MTGPVDPQLLDFCTARQREILEAWIRTGSLRKAAAELKTPRGNISGVFAAVKKKAALRGYAPEADMCKPTAAPFVVKGTSTLYDDMGNTKLQWVKTKLDDQQAEAMIREWIESLTQDAKGMSPPVAPPKHTNADLLAVYPIGDPHIGMYSWAQETGADFDAGIASRQIRGAFDRLVSSAPPAETALVIELGDLIHADNSKNVTPANANALDVDTRWQKVMQIGADTLVYAVKRTLSKHKRVLLRVVPGNHDPHAGVAVGMVLKAYFHNNPRVTVDTSPAEHWYYRFSKVLIGATHGDKAKFAAMPGIMACDRPQDWGQTKFRYWYQGHIHHGKTEEYPGCIVEAFRTLAAPDAWSAGRGYRSGRDMCVLVHHKEFGEVERHRCDIGMIEETK